MIDVNSGWFTKTKRHKIYSDKIRKSLLEKKRVTLRDIARAYVCDALWQKNFAGTETLFSEEEKNSIMRRAGALTQYKAKPYLGLLRFLQTFGLITDEKASANRSDVAFLLKHQYLGLLTNYNVWRKKGGARAACEEMFAHIYYNFQWLLRYNVIFRCLADKTKIKEFALFGVDTAFLLGELEAGFDELQAAIIMNTDGRGANVSKEMYGFLLEALENLLADVKEIEFTDESIQEVYDAIDVNKLGAIEGWYELFNMFIISALCPDCKAGVCATCGAKVEIENGEETK